VSALHFLDTNILLYSISINPLDREKRHRAAELLEESGSALSVQVLQEFYVQATRPTRIKPLSHNETCDLIDTWRRFRIQDVTRATFDAALEICRAHRFSYWDSAIIAAARALGCDTLYTEDLSHGREIEGVRIVNPFR
jgi:predicted nucleic acid-binding protein